MKTSDFIEQLVPYKPGKDLAETLREYGLNKAYKLASNENALGVSPKVKLALQESLSEVFRYPDPSCYVLRACLSKKLNVEPSLLSFGNGSNEVIDILIRVFCQSGDRVLTSKAAFIAYKICAQAAGIHTDEVEMTKGLQIDAQAIMDAWTPAHKLVFVPNPNNPTGTYLSKDKIIALVDFFKSKECLLILDEAYVEFVRAKDYIEGLDLWNKNSNLILLRTLSKSYGLAGLRLGYMLANEQVTDYFNRVRNPFNVNHLAQVAAVAALGDDDYISRSQKLVWEGLDYFYENFDRLGIEYIPSQANFVLFKCPQAKTGKEFYQLLLKKGVISRPVVPYGLSNYIRLSVGLMAENEVAMKAISEVL